MKKENTSFFSRIFGAKSSKPAIQQVTSVILTSSSQPHVLKQRMEEENMTHGETITANIAPVRLERIYKDEAVLYFCPMKKIDVLQVTAAGDGGQLPSNATLDGFSIAPEYKSGLYRIKNVEITSNGTMQVRATATTTWERIDG